MKQVLIAGFGNIYRRDDGAGPAVVNSLREHLERSPLGTLDDGFDDLGHSVDTVVLHQLVPEFADTIADYDLLILVDAHVGVIPEALREVRLQAMYEMPLVPHHFRPETVLALVQQIHGHAPTCILLSLRGHDFDFGEGLSDETAALIPTAVARILEWVEQ